MEKCAPDHIKRYCYIAGNEDITFQNLIQKYEDNYTFVYKIKCICGNKQFHVYRDKHPTVEVDCPICKEHISVYDLKYYPAATKLDKPYMPELLSDELCYTYVIFEYSDEFEKEEDVEFDINDISWCHVYIENVTTKEISKIVNDETS